MSLPQTVAKLNFGLVLSPFVLLGAMLESATLQTIRVEPDSQVSNPDYCGPLTQEVEGHSLVTVFGLWDLRVAISGAPIFRS